MLLVTGYLYGIMAFMKHVDNVIVGQGLAGSILAWTLIQQGQSVLVIDDNHNSASSIIAAGIMNPVTGPRLVKHALSEHYFQQALSCYQDLERFFKKTLFYPTPIIRLFNSPVEINAYAKRSRDPNYRDYLGRSFDNSGNPDINSPLGGFYQSKTGYVDVATLLQLLKNYFIQNACYLSENFSYRSVTLTSNNITVNTYSSNRIIFCEGYRLRANPWFAGLPIIPTKGEILTLTSSKFCCSSIINNGHWLLPLQQGMYRFGASFEPHHEDTLASTKVRLQLMEKLSRMVTSDPVFDVVGHSVGIRPCTQDRMPLIGMHPHFQQIGVFNGFGSKGILTIPYFASLFSRSIRNIDQVHREASITRFGYHREKHVFGKPALL